MPGLMEQMMPLIEIDLDASRTHYRRVVVDERASAKRDNPLSDTRRERSANSFARVARRKLRLREKTSPAKAVEKMK